MTYTSIALSLLGWLLISASFGLRFAKFMGNQKRAAEACLTRRPR